MLRSNTDLSRSFASSITSPVTRAAPEFTESGFAMEHWNNRALEVLASRDQVPPSAKASGDRIGNTTAVKRARVLSLASSHISMMTDFILVCSFFAPILVALMHKLCQTESCELVLDNPLDHQRHHVAS